jgi:hypothetical protein
MVQCNVGKFDNLILDFSLTHPQCGVSKVLPSGSWKFCSLARITAAKDQKHAISYEQGNHAYLSLTADTYSKISNDFVQFLWMVANSASQFHSRFTMEVP